MEFGVEHLMRDIAHLQHTREELGYLDGCRADKNGAAAVAHLDYLVDHGVVFLACCLIDTVLKVFARYGTVCRNLHDIKLIDVPELTGFRHCSTCHAGKLVVHAEIVLQRDSGECLCRSLHAHMLFRLDSLMEAVAPASAFHDTSCLFVNDFHLAVDDNVFVILVEHTVGLEQLLECMHTL